MKQRPHFSTKPYYRCFLCPDFRTTCGGLPTRDMDMKNFCEYLSDTIDFFGLSTEEVTRKADSSLKTTEKIKACSIEQDMLRGTARRYEIAVFGSASRHACYRDIDFSESEKIAELLKQVESLTKDKERLAKIVDRLLEK